jgi:colicin import membrane protein
MADRDPARDEFATSLVAAAKAETPRKGAAERALSKVMPRLGVASASEPVAPPKQRWVRREIVGAFLAAALLLAGIRVKLAHDADAARSAAEARFAEQQAQEDALIAGLTRQIQEQKDTVDKLHAAATQAKDDAVRAAALAQLEAAKARAAEASAVASRARAARAAGAGGNSGQRAKAACNCSPGDALCSCIP